MIARRHRTYGRREINFAMKPVNGANVEEFARKPCRWNSQRDRPAVNVFWIGSIVPSRHRRADICCNDNRVNTGGVNAQDICDPSGQAEGRAGLRAAIHTVIEYGGIGGCYHVRMKLGLANPAKRQPNCYSHGPCVFHKYAFLPPAQFPINR